jgi:hypothetical protein
MYGKCKLQVKRSSRTFLSVSDTESGIYYVENTEDTEPTALNTAKSFNVVYSFLNITSISK